MLQKLIMVIVSLVTMVASSVVPPGWLSEDAAPVAPASVVDERITTLGYVPGKEFARVSVLWVEVDGQRVDDDAWGQGHLDSIRFKIGIKRAEGNALKLGDRTVALAPTDVFTIRGFEGRYSFADLATASASIALDGTVKNTLVNAGKAGSSVATGGTSSGSRGGAPERLAYVELDTGAPVGTIEVSSGGAKKLATVGSSTAATESGATSIDVRWVKLDDALVTSYTYGDGELARISFAPDTRFRSHLDVSGTGLAFEEGDRVEIRDFLGAWSVAMRPGGGARLRLDGWADAADVLPGTTTLNSEPELAFSYTPAAPSTRDIVHFTADARDRDGTVVVHDWTFLRKLPADATSMTSEDLITARRTGPTAEHRFTRPGTWEVTLRVVDDQGGATTVTQDIVIANTEPVVAFDWFPSSPVSLEQVRFFDRSSDLDGGVVSRHWDFGDGRTSVDAEPTNTYARNGVYTVTLRITDANGGQDTKTKVIAVRNAPPDCAFELDPPSPISGEVATLLDASRDREGDVAGWNWTVRNLVNASVPVFRHTVRNPTYTFERADTYRVELKVTDLEGETSTCAQDVLVGNKGPVASFTVSPPNPKTGQFVYLTSTSTDHDGRIIVYNWTIEGDPEVKHGSQIGYTFRRADAFDIALQVTDNGGKFSINIQTVHVQNSPPTADFTFAPTAPKTNEEVSFSDASRDPDGDDITDISWDFGPGEVPRTAVGPNARHAFATNGVHMVTIHATDSGGRTSSVVKPVLVENRLPTGTATHSKPAIVGEPVTFNVEASDPDGTVVGYTWLFSDGTSAEGQTVTHTFSEAGPFRVKVTLTDDDDGRQDVDLDVVVGRAGPIVDFLVEPGVAAVGRPTTFRDLTTSNGPALATWDWDFGDTTAHSSQRNASHVYTRPGTFKVTLQVTDADGTIGEASRFVTSTHPPVAAFTLTPTTVPAGGIVRLIDQSTDDGGIVSRTWKIDGVEESSAPDWERPFTGRGDHTVELTVVDNHGVATSKTEKVTVLNQKPVAEFSVDSPVIRNQPARFRSTSFDPDGTIVQYSWLVFDLQRSSVAGDPTAMDFTFPNSGRFAVKLVVKDDAGATTTVERTIDVFAETPATYSVAARYTDGSVAPIDGIGVRIRDTRTNTVYESEIVADPAHGFLNLTLAPGTWIVGTPYQVTVTRNRFDTNITFNTLASDISTRGRVVHIVPLARTLAPPTLVIRNGTEPGESDTLPGLFDLAVPADPGVYYPSQRERFHGTVTASWATAPAPAANAYVEVWARRMTTRDAQSGITVAAVECPVLVCAKATGNLEADGSLTFDIPFMTASLGNGLDVNPAGWYMVEAKVSWPNALPNSNISPVTARVKVFVDAEGLLQRVLGTSLP